MSLQVRTLFSPKMQTLWKIIMNMKSDSRIQIPLRENLIRIFKTFCTAANYLLDISADPSYVYKVYTPHTHTHHNE